MKFWFKPSVVIKVSNFAISGRPRVALICRPVQRPAWYMASQRFLLKASIIAISARRKILARPFKEGKESLPVQQVKEGRAVN